MRTYFLAVLTILLFISFLACAQDKNDDNATDDDDSSPPCEPTCWQHSPEQATGSQDQIEEWAAECQNADSGCEGRYCVATRMEFQNAPDDLKYSVQCESGVSEDLYCEYYWSGGASSENSWLGPDYGYLSNKNLYVCDPDPDDAWTVTGWAQIPGGSGKKWTSEKVADSLAHDITITDCEDIADLKICIRSFIPPDIHCTPKFDTISYTQFVGCESRQEPFNRPLNWRDVIPD
ncbi:MAG: hypothetical protein GX444_04895 [Myxococcales bacterium]|nr:hypothetical protein [Myxococcales bacterium]